MKDRKFVLYNRNLNIIGIIITAFIFNFSACLIENLSCKMPKVLLTPETGDAIADVSMPLLSGLGIDSSVKEICYKDKFTGKLPISISCRIQTIRGWFSFIFIMCVRLYNRISLLIV